MSDAEINIEDSTIEVEIDGAPVQVGVDAAPVEVSIDAAPIEVGVESDSPEVIVEISGAPGSKGEPGGFDPALTWVRLKSSATTDPVPNPEPPQLGGEVWDYTYGSTTYYRHIPEPYDPTQDTFYALYSNGVLGTPIASKGVPI